jgi:L-ribulose-5-phosphate 4-epimerase
MSLQQLKQEVLEANLEVVRRGLVLFTFGNASGIARDQGLVVIKPSGVPYENLKPENMVVSDLSGKIIEGNLKPSSDLPTHLVLYRVFPQIGGVVHTHSEYATAWAQAGVPIPCMGTTHADYFCGEVPVTEALREAEIANDYEYNTGLAIERAFRDRDPEQMPAVLVTGHAPFCWGKDAAEAAHHAVVLESVARMAYLTLSIENGAQPISQALLDKHFFRKHGQAAYYGQLKRS